MSTLLISVYFDEETNEYIAKLMSRIASKISSSAMRKIPPHITVGMIRTDDVESAILEIKKIADKSSRMELQLASVGLFGSKVVYLQPVLSKELLGLCELVDEMFIGYVPSASKYRPYGWIPHITLAKHLSAEQQLEAIKMLQSENILRKIKIEKIGLATTKPYKDVAVYELK